MRPLQTRGGVARSVRGASDATMSPKPSRPVRRPSATLGRSTQLIETGDMVTSNGRMDGDMYQLPGPDPDCMIERTGVLSKFKVATVIGIHLSDKDIAEDELAVLTSAGETGWIYVDRVKKL